MWKVTEDGYLVDTSKVLYYTYNRIQIGREKGYGVWAHFENHNHVAVKRFDSETAAIDYLKELGVKFGATEY